MEVQQQIVDALMKPEAYPEDPGQIELVQTHISYVFLTSDFVYKMKKAVDFGFLDFKTLEKRHLFCMKELELNRRLCGDMYLAVVPINESDTIKIEGEGETVEYAVKMKRMPQERMMNRLLEEKRVDRTLIDQIAKIISDFHSKAETNENIDKFGSLSIIRKNWDENFEQTQEFIDETISADDFELIRERINAFMRKNQSFFERRVAEGRVRDCHGDIHSGNIFITDRIYIFDVIEFNERFRYSDVASDIAFLTMDLDFRERRDLSDFFIERYIGYSEDADLVALLPFYKCYRAYVRGKVTSFRLKDPSIGRKEKSLAAEEAKAYFSLASAYARAIES